MSLCGRRGGRGGRAVVILIDMSQQQRVVNKWIRRERELVLDSPWIKIYKDTLQMPVHRMGVEQQGRCIDDFFVKEERDWACVLAVTPSNCAVLVEQYRPGCDQVCLELPAGTLDTGDASPEMACLRELQEETGFVVHEGDTVSSLGRLVCDPNRDLNCAYGFVVRLSQERPDTLQKLDDSEDIAVRLLPLHILKSLALGETLVEEGRQYCMLHGTQITFILRALHRLETERESNTENNL